METEICISYKLLDDAELYTFEQITPYFESQILWLKKLGSFYLYHKHSFPFPCIAFHNSETQAFQKTELLFFSLKSDSTSFGNKPGLLTIFIYYILFLFLKYFIIHIIWLLGTMVLPSLELFCIIKYKP